MKKQLSSKKKLKIFRMFGDYIDDINDVTGGKKTSPLFGVWARMKAHLLTGETDSVLSRRAVVYRRRIKPIIKLIGPLFLSCKQRIESRAKLPEQPVIYVSNHHFKDDAAGTALACKRNAWFLFGSLPQFFNSFDGISAWLNGVILINRNNKKSKQRAYNLCVDALNTGVDIIVYPEGVWNKTPNKPILDLWPGFYRLSKETGCPVVPVIHYKREFQSTNKKDIIHTIVDNPIDVSKMDELEAIRVVRDRMATLYWNLMEKYGQSTRTEELKGFKSASECWEHILEKLVKTVKRYDSSIETKSDYRRQDIHEKFEALKDIVSVKNISATNAKIIVKLKEQHKALHDNDFQRRF